MSISICSPHSSLWVAAKARRSRSVHNFLTTQTSSRRSVFLYFSSASVHSPRSYSRRELHWRSWITSICSFRNHAIFNSFTCVGFEMPWSTSHLTFEVRVPSLIFRKSGKLCEQVLLLLASRQQILLSSAISQRVLQIGAMAPACF